jgi:hypothetical protein
MSTECKQRAHGAERNQCSTLEDPGNDDAPASRRSDHDARCPMQVITMRRRAADCRDGLKRLVVTSGSRDFQKVKQHGVHVPLDLPDFVPTLLNMRRERGAIVDCPCYLPAEFLDQGSALLR